MGVVASTIQALLPPGFSSTRTSTSPSFFQSTPAGQFEAYSRQAYAGNEIVYAAVKLLSTSAAEPHIIGRRWRRNRPERRQATRALARRGIHNRAGAMLADDMLIRNGFFEEVDDHMLIDLLNNPNPWTSRGQLWSTLVMDRLLAGNAYALKVRAKAPFKDVPVELWRLRPDRVTVIPSAENVIEAYEYKAGSGEVKRIPARDILHFKEPHPLDEFYGMPPLMAVMERVSIDNFMRRFLRTFFEKGGTGPGAILSVKQKLAETDKNEIRERLKRLLGGVNGFHETLILDNAESEYTQMGLDRGLRDALPKEIDAMNEARIAMAFHIPGSIVGLLIGYESSSYANKRQDWQVLWDVTMSPLMSDMDDVLNLGLVPEFEGIDEVMFDLSEIHALQEDVDALHDRARKNVGAGIWTLEEGRMLTGVPSKATDDQVYLLPLAVQPTKQKDIELVSPPDQREPGSGGEGDTPDAPPPSNRLNRSERIMIGQVGRPRLEDDTSARAIYDEAMRLRERNHGMSWEQIAARVGVVERTLRRYRDTFDSDE